MIHQVFHTVAWDPPTPPLQDFFRPIVSPNYTEVSRDSGDGIAEFSTYDDMKLAIRKCDDTEFIKGHDKTGCFIRLYELERGGGGGGGGYGGGGDRDRDRGRGRDRSRSVMISVSEIFLYVCVPRGLVGPSCLFIKQPQLHHHDA